MRMLAGAALAGSLLFVVLKQAAAAPTVDEHEPTVPCERLAVTQVELAEAQAKYGGDLIYLDREAAQAFVDLWATMTGNRGTIAVSAVAAHSLGQLVDLRFFSSNGCLAAVFLMGPGDFALINRVISAGWRKR